MNDFYECVEPSVENPFLISPFFMDSTDLIFFDKNRRLFSLDPFPFSGFLNG